MCAESVREPRHQAGVRRAHRQRAVVSLALAGLLGAACLYLWAFSPHDPASVYPPCPTKLLTGFDCPGCGALRMGHDLLRGDLLAAAHDNVFLLVLTPVVAIWGGWFWWQYRRGQRPGVPVRAGVLLFVAALAWGVVRNLPGFPLTPS
ncbi:DUF2752 domain-containing protein [Hoyosella sp. YIM 151337]|uniref:DUF2752 domain-containing protein n=1 Tax=Hoyosella sp. YIM 151337 TaxID=2992742 RepID=UPI0022364E87|nr:DUF2752 domain-containing protein [Hoyosella sp. YIM 151337]MCW4355589.1 DUF2752 domain-containing protein [Hoyosella sp. YIM 151337]